MCEEMTEYRIADFDDETDSVVAYTHDNKKRILVAAVIEDDGETVDVVASKTLFKKQSEK